jgi:smad nuclear-interacting protein 1
MSPTEISVRGRRHDDQLHSPSRTAALPHRRSRRSISPANSSIKRDKYNVTTKSHRARRDGDVLSESPRPSKKRRTSESRSRSPPRRHMHRDRSRSPYRKDKKSHDERRHGSRSPYKKEKRSRRRNSLSRSRSRSPPRRKARRHDSNSRSASPPPKYRQERKSVRARSHESDKRTRKPLPSQEVAFKGELDPESGALDKPIEKQKPNFANTGLLAKEANTVVGTKIVLKYNEPPEARKPPSSQKWQLYVFKGDDIVDEVPLYTQSCWLLGREAAVADIHVEHPSSSKQHAVIQFRHSVKMNEFGDKQNIVRPYLIDLDSANGTKLNGDKIKDSRYYEIRDKDMIKIGLSEREYVFMLPPSS